MIVCPPFQKERNPNFANFKKGGDLKKIWGRGNQKGEKIFKIKGGDPTLQVKFRDRKGQKWGLSETN